MSELTDEERQNYINQLKECEKEGTEDAHINADNILCEILTKLGYDDIVKEFDKLDKWYA